ncbi:Fungal Zn2-Cys6 binuclear cluster domain-containing protein [Cladophialophora immunda]|nr:Fungal Zn2-Cys6 binuclear cluster domain-containing protein [Cladophialophora immunda]
MEGDASRFNSHLLEETPPTKTRRIARACLQCRARKQRCLPAEEHASLGAACKRCKRHDVPCSFQTEQQDPTISLQGANADANLLSNIQARLNNHERRLAELEAQGPLQQDDGLRLHALSPNPSTISSQDGYNAGEPRNDGPMASTDQSSRDPNQRILDMNAVDLGPPISTLRSLGAMHGNQSLRESSSNAQNSGMGIVPTQHRWPLDPILNGVLTMAEACQAINIFFNHCHPMAPVLSEGLRSQPELLRANRPMLFLALCSIGTRFWLPESAFPRGWPTLHPKCSELAVLLDKAVSRLLLRPTPRDVHLDSVVVLLLYAQWMPYSRQGYQDRNDHDHERRFKRPSSRYNDISAWAVLGLAARYATMLNLAKDAIAPFTRPQTAATQDDMARLRIWYNLLTCDWNLMLSSALPATLDPTEGVSIARSFGVQPTAQQPNDLRYAALVELVGISHSALETNKEFSARRLNAASLRKFNVACDEWERHWSPILRFTHFQHVHLPFTSLRWCRLALNSAVLGPYLTSITQEDSQPSHVWVLEALETSLTAAMQIIFCVSTLGHDYVWRISSQDASTVPAERFVVDQTTLERLSYAVDSMWVSYTFAVTFLAFCYVKGLVDDELRLRRLMSASSPQNVAPRSPRSISLLARFLRLALDLFDAICQISTFRLAQELQAVVKDCVLLLLTEDCEARTHGQEVDTTGMQSLFDQMMDPGFDWPALAEDWNICGTPSI